MIWGHHSHEKVVQRDKVQHNVWILPAPFCAMRYVNNGRYLTADDDQELDHVRNMPKNNVELYRSRFWEGPFCVQSHRILAI